MKDSVFPAEWESHAAVCMAWPEAADLWQENLEGAQQEFVDLCRAILLSEKLILCVGSESEQSRIKGILPQVQVLDIPYGDIWLRDTAPLFVRTASAIQALGFQFNGWGRKYLLENDPELSARMLRALNFEQKASFSPLVFEGGSIDVNGQGLALTTRECLLNSNRNPEWTLQKIENHLGELLGIHKWIWLDQGLLNDHTDGHIDNIARFVNEKAIVCMRARSKSQANFERLESIYKELKNVCADQGLELLSLPSPGDIFNEDGKVMPASYMNFYISNRHVIMPSYGTEFDKEAALLLQECFLDREVLALNSKHILSGGGSFHCITQQIPQERRPL